MTRVNAHAEKSFPEDVRDHVLTVLRDDGLYRHLRFAKPGTSVCSFSIVTWPGGLCFFGDMGSFVFRRIEDMLAFFRHNAPNYGYWAEKCVAADRDGSSPGLREFSAEYFRERVLELAKAHFEENEVNEETRSEVLAELESQVLSHEDDERGARNALSEFDEFGVSFSDTWEHSFEQFTYRFVWCCNALVWAIKRYDERDQPSAVVGEKPAEGAGSNDHASPAPSVLAGGAT